MNVSNNNDNMFLVQLIKKLDQRTNTMDDENGADMNVISEQFRPVDETLALSETVEQQQYTPSTFVWGNGTTIDAGWDWGHGGKWNA